MKIIIFSPTSTKLTPTSIEDRPLGGADQALLRMIRALANSHNVKAYIPVDKHSVHKGVSYYPFQDLLKDEHECDIIIHYRKCWAIPSGVKYKEAVFYSQDDVDAPCFSGAGEGYFDLYKYVIALSNYHAERLMERFNIPTHKIKVIGNGASPQHLVKKEKKKFIYCSTPFRGLVVLVKMWKEIIKIHPDAELHIFSSMKIYDGEEHDKIYFKGLYEKMQKIKGIIYHGVNTQEEMLKCMRTCTALLYPNTFPETYCNVLMEARACYTPFITSDKGALKETGGNAGLYLEPDMNPYHPDYQKRFIDMVNILIDFPCISEVLRDLSYPIRMWRDHAYDLNHLMGCIRIGIESADRKGDEQ